MTRPAHGGRVPMARRQLMAEPAKLAVTLAAVAAAMALVLLLAGEGDLEPLREAGFSDDDILHIAELTAIFNFNGRIANGLGLMPNPEYYTLGRKLDEPD